MRQDDGASSGNDAFGNWWRTGDPAADSPFGSTNNETWSSVESNNANDVTFIRPDMSALNEWISFFFMTIGWFTLLTSLLGFYRVKRWERGILSPQQPATPRTAAEVARENALLSHLQIAFGIGGQRDSEGEIVVHESAAAGRADVPVEEEDAGAAIARRRETALQSDRRIREGLQAAGLL